MTAWRTLASRSLPSTWSRRLSRSSVSSSSPAQNRSMLPLPAALGAIRLTSVEDEVLERHAHAYLASSKELL
ncbi:MAG: hypothetical protein ACLTYW_01300 [Collinsella sp.]